MADLAGVLQALKLGPTIPVAIHPVRDFFPFAGVAFVERLVADIRANGLRQPIVKCDGAILDGRSRYLACLVAGIEPTFTFFEGTDDEALNFVISTDIIRADFNIHARAMIAAKIANCEHGGDRRSHQGLILNLEKITVDDAAKRLHVSRSYVLAARKVLNFGSQKLVDVVTTGEFPVNIAANVCENFEPDEVCEIITVRGVESLRPTLDEKKRETKSREKLVELKFRVPYRVLREFEILRCFDDKDSFFVEIYKAYKLSESGRARIDGIINGSSTLRLPQIYETLSPEERATYIHTFNSKAANENAEAA